MSYEKIRLPQDKNSKEPKWTLIFDQNIISIKENALLTHVQKQFDQNRMDPEGATEDEIQFKKTTFKARQRI